MRIWPGSPSPLGATWDGSGVNFALFSKHATNVELCLFDAPDARTERVRIALAERTNFVWHAYLPDVRPGQIYGYRVHGPWDTGVGDRFNPAKVLLDPYARQFGRTLEWHPSLFAFERGSRGDGPPDLVDSAPYAALGQVEGDDPFDWGSDRRPSTRWSDTVLYEAHVKGFTALNREIPAPLRGTFLGLASDQAIGHLKRLGVTTVELMPVHAHADEWQLAEAGRTNYWGYNTLSFFIPDTRFATSPRAAVKEFKTMVRALHAAGLEVILDVVYNHTAEGDQEGPTFSLRGIDNRYYYRLEPARPSHYENFSGCGNTLDGRALRVQQLIMDSLRYWVDEMHVDGFRFDLTSALARESPHFDPRAAFFHVIAQDPVISRLKLIAEPWDVGHGGYQVGQFPAGWSEWNDQYRDDIRRFWRGDRGTLPRLATRLAGSSDLYGASGRGPGASVNFVTAHDGFTLADLVSHSAKHNEANGEHNRDGENNNLSSNSGIEGPTEDPDILAVRERRRRSIALTMLLSLGVPMLSGGDEMGRSQAGNNNGYCHDSPLTWTPWHLSETDRSFLAFVQSLAAFRAAQPVLRRRAFLNGRGQTLADVRWLRPEGEEMTAADWGDADRRALGMLLDGRAIEDKGPHGERIQGATLLIVLNASDRHTSFRLPPALGMGGWQLAFDTWNPTHLEVSWTGRQDLTVGAWSAMVLEMTE